MTSVRPADTMRTGTSSAASRSSRSSAPARHSIFASRTIRGSVCRCGWPCFTISACAVSHHSTPSIAALLCQSSSGANSSRNACDISGEKPTRSWHWIDLPVVSVASKSVTPISLSIFAVFSIAARLKW